MKSLLNTVLISFFSIILMACGPRDNILTGFTPASEGGGSVLTTQGQVISKCQRRDGTPSRWRTVQLNKEFYTAEEARKVTATFALGTYNCNEVGAIVDLSIGAYKAGQFQYKQANRVGKKRVTKVEIVNLSDIGDKYASMAELSTASLKDMIQATRSSRVREPNKVVVVHLEDVGEGANAGTSSDQPTMVSKPGEMISECNKAWSAVQLNEAYYSAEAANAISASFALGAYNCNEVGATVDLSLGKYVDGKFQYKQAEKVGQKQVKQVEVVNLSNISERHAKMANLSVAALKDLIAATKSDRVREPNKVVIVYFEGGETAESGASDEWVGQSFSVAGERPGVCSRPPSYTYKTLTFNEQFYSADDFGPISAHFDMGTYNCMKIGVEVSFRVGPYEAGEFLRSGFRRVSQNMRTVKIEFIGLSDLNETHAAMAGLSLVQLKESLRVMAHPNAEKDIVRITHLEATGN